MAKLTDPEMLGIKTHFTNGDGYRYRIADWQLEFYDPSASVWRRADIAEALQRDDWRPLETAEERAKALEAEVARLRKVEDELRGTLSKKCDEVVELEVKLKEAALEGEVNVDMVKDVAKDAKFDRDLALTEVKRLEELLRTREAVLVAQAKEVRQLRESREAELRSRELEVMEREAYAHQKSGWTGATADAFSRIARVRRGEKL